MHEGITVPIRYLPAVILLTWAIKDVINGITDNSAVDLKRAGTMVAYAAMVFGVTYIFDKITGGGQ